MDEQDIKARTLELVKQHPHATLATIDEKGFPHMRPMHTAGIDEDFTVHFATGRNLRKVSQISADARVSVSWSAFVEDRSTWTNALLKGLAHVTDDADLRYRFWSDEFEQYFPQGKDDPNYVIIVVKPVRLLFLEGWQYPPSEVVF